MTRFVLLTFATAVLAAAEPAVVWTPQDFSIRTESVPGNPFDAELAVEAAGPGGMRLRVPGFYDGDGVWKIRFSPARPGRWRLRSVSPVAALNGREWELEAQPAPAHLHGRLRIRPDAPRHLAWEDGTPFFLMGYEADWLWAAGQDDPERKRLHQLVRSLDRHGFNYVFVNVYAHDTRWCPGRVNEWDVAPSRLFPWEGSNDRPDHSRLNPAFFKEWDAMMDALHRRGIAVHVMLKVYNKFVNWPEAGSDADLRFFRYVSARYQAYPNVVWDVSKEAFKEPSKSYLARMISVLRGSDAYQHLVALHDDDEFFWDPATRGLTDFRVDQEHRIDWAELARFDRALAERPVVNAEFGYELGVENLPTHANVNQVDGRELARRAYTLYFQGAYAAYYYNNTAWDVIKPDPEPPGMAYWAVLKRTLTRVPWWTMEPQPAMGASAACLASRTQAACFIERAEAAVDLTRFQGALQAHWIHAWTGRQEPAALQPGRPQRIRKPPSFQDAPAVLMIRSKD